MNWAVKHGHAHLADEAADEALIFDANNITCESVPTAWVRLLHFLTLAFQRKITKLSSVQILLTLAGCATDSDTVEHTRRPL